jgi:ketosteroid isomerase-like protein
MSRENVELVRAAFGNVAIPGDPEPMIEAIEPGFQMQLAAVGGGAAYYAGAEGIREWFSDVGRSWESFRFEAKDVRDLGDRVLVLGEVRGCGRVSGIEVSDRWAWIVRVVNGKVAGVRGFLDQGEAIAAAGLSE